MKWVASNSYFGVKVGRGQCFPTSESISAQVAEKQFYRKKNPDVSITTHFIIERRAYDLKRMSIDTVSCER